MDQALFVDQPFGLDLSPGQAQGELR